MNYPSVSSWASCLLAIATLSFWVYLVALWKSEKYSLSQPILVLMLSSSSNLVEDALLTKSVPTSMYRFTLPMVLFIYCPVIEIQSWQYLLPWCSQ